MAQVQAQAQGPQGPQGQPNEGRYKQAFGTMGNQMVTSLWDYMQAPENKARLVNVLDPLIQHIIKSIFPYIAFSAILFVLLLIIAILTLVVTLKATGYNPVSALVDVIPTMAAITSVIPTGPTVSAVTAAAENISS